MGLDFMYPERPLTRFPQFFGGVAGVPQIDAQQGMRNLPRGVTIYVDPNHGNASDLNYGTDPDHPKATIQSAVNSTLLTTNSWIVLQPGMYTESVVCPDYATGPNYVTIMGAGNSRYGTQWQSAAVDAIALDMRAVGWRVSNIRFYGQVSASCVALRHTDTGANDIAIRTIIDHCYFDGLTTGLRGIESHGCYDVWIHDCTFALWHTAGSTGIGMEVLTTPLAIPYRNYIYNNIFHDSDNGMAWESNGSFFWGNTVQPTGYAYAMTIVFQTSTVANPGDDNVVWGNTFPGDYSLVGGYRGGAADAWLGNWADDIVEAEVADNGITILPPA